MKTQAAAPAEHSKQASTSTSEAIQQKPGELSFADNRPEATLQRQAIALMNNSPQALQQKARSDMLNNSPQTLAQRKQQNAWSGGVIQQQEEAEPLPKQLATEIPLQRQEAPSPKPNNTGLPDNLKSGVESLSGISLDQVKVHYNSPEPAQLNAHAYAQGSDIHVAPGQEQHLPHEAWHVVQQAQGRVKPTMQMKGNVPVNDDAGLEAEADRMGAQALQMKSELNQLQTKEAQQRSALSSPKQLSRVAQLAKHNNNVQARVDHARLGFNTQHGIAAFSAPDVLKEATDYGLATTAATLMDSTAVPAIGGGQTAVNPAAVENYINWVKQKLNTAGVAAGSNESTIRWGGTWNGLGTTMTAILRPGGEPAGSEPSIGWTGVWGLLYARKRKKNDPTIYVMGHMLNDNIGGPGLAYNLTPLMGKFKAWGATDSNGLHLSSIETDVKNKYDEMHADPTQVSRVDYNVTAVYGRAPRTAQIATLNIVAQDYQTAMADPGTVNHQDAKNYIKANNVVSAINIDAVSTAVGANWNMNPANILPLIQGNRALWIAEDIYVPVRLDCDYTWYDGANTANASGNIPIPVTLPDDIKATYQP